MSGVPLQPDCMSLATRSCPRACFRSLWLRAAKELPCAKSPKVAQEGMGLKVFLACVKPSASMSGLDVLEVASGSRSRAGAALEAVVG